MQRNIKKDWTRKELDKYIKDMKTTTLAANITVEGTQRVLDLSEVEEILRGADLLAQQTCYCREKMGNCKEPMDGCINLNEEAQDMIEKGEGREVSVEEAMEAFVRTYDAGFVHMAYDFESQDGIAVICSCCTCCCHSLAAALRFGYRDHVFESKMIAVQDIDKCNDCGHCVDRCQFGAREMVEGTLIYNEKMCFGCGLCMTCPQDAIEMVKRF